MADTNPDLSKMEPAAARLILGVDDELELPFTPLTPIERSWQPLSLTGFDKLELSQKFDRLGVERLTWIVRVESGDPSFPDSMIFQYAMTAQMLQRATSERGPITLRSFAMVHLRRDLHAALQGERPLAADGIVFLTDHGWIERVENLWLRSDV